MSAHASLADALTGAPFVSFDTIKTLEESAHHAED